MRVDGLSRRSGCVVAAVLLLFSVCVSPAAAGVRPGGQPRHVRASHPAERHVRARLPANTDFTITGPGAGTGVAGFIGPDSLNPLDGYPTWPIEWDQYTRHDVDFAGMILGQKHDGTPLQLYCIDLDHVVQYGTSYRFAPWSEAEVPNLGYISRILHDYYPNTNEPAGLTPDYVKAVAVQSAIWFFAAKYFLAPVPPIFDATSEIVNRVIAEGPLPPPQVPELRISGPDGIQANVVSGPFTIHTTAARAAVHITGGEMFADAAGTQPIPNGTELSNGETFYVRSAEPGRVRLSATAQAVRQAGETGLYVQDTDDPEAPAEGQKVILATDVNMNLDAHKEVEVTEGPPVPPVPPVPPKHKPSLKIQKWVRPEAYHRAGQALRFQYKVTNTGDVPLDRVLVDDPKRGLSAVHCPQGSLRPGQSMICTATYRVTKKDLRNRSVRNCAAANGRDPASGTPVRSRRACARAYGAIPVTG
ncbi:thioester domain-containing protein [Spirillospora sp. NPDC052269]